MKKKIIMGLLVTSLILSITACGDKDKTSGSDTQSSTSNTANTEGIDYSKLSFTPADINVTEEDIDKGIQEIIDSGYKPAESDSTVVDDCDIVTITGQVLVDNEVYFEYNEDKYNTAMVDTYMPEFMDNIIGAELNKEIEFSIVYPENTGGDLAGKTAVHKLSVVKIEDAVRYEANDELAQACGLNTYEELREAIKRNLEIEADDAAAETNHYNAIMAYVDAFGIVYSDDEVAELLNNRLDFYKESAKAENMEYEDYVLMYFNTSVEEFEANCKESVAFEILVEKVTEDIIEKENIALTDENYIKGLEDIAERYGVTTDDVKAAFTEEDIKDTILRGLAVDTLLANLMK